MAIVICPRVSSPPDGWRLRGAWRAFAIALAACLLWVVARAEATTLGAGRLALAVSRVDHPAFAIRDLSLHAPGSAASLTLEIAQLRIGASEFRRLTLRCAQGELGYPFISCRGGRLRIGSEDLPWRIDVDLDLETGKASAIAHGEGAARADFHADANGRLHGRIARLPLADAAVLLQPLVAAPAAWKAGGVVDGEIEWLAPGAVKDAAAPDGRLIVRGTIDGGSFGSADGLHAGEKLGVDFRFDASRQRGRWRGAGSIDWRSGAAYWHPFFLEAGARLDAAGTMQGDRLELQRASLRLEGFDALAATAVIDLRRRHLVNGALTVSRADLAIVGPRWIAPLVAPQAAERLRFAGHVSAGVHVRDGVLDEVDAAFDQAGFSLPGAAGGGLALGPVSGHVPWRAKAGSRAEVSVAGGRWERLTLGPFSLAAELQGDRLAFARSSIPLLDGAVVLDGLAMQRGADGWRGSGQVVVEPVSMRLLTEALGLPSMGGVLAASIPALKLRPGEIALEGALLVSVFDGYVQATGLRVREPFGVASHLSADIEARHIDLAQLTDTFRFGSITGFVDADVQGLELMHWRPVRFDARIASSAGSYPRRISQRAVQNISALGGAGASAAIQRGVIGLFDTFGYRELGFHCVLRADVCLADGIAGARRADDGFVIVRGGGVPALDVIGYNRRIDWNELIERLQRVISGKVAPELR